MNLWINPALAAVLGGEDAALSNNFLVIKLLWIFSSLIGWIFATMSFLIPATRLRETPNLLAFHHPSPSYKFHVLIIPKRQVDSLASLDPADTAFLTDLYAAVQSLVEEYQLKAYRLIVNGGEFQDFPHLHFHLTSPSPQPISSREMSKE